MIRKARRISRLASTGGELLVPWGFRTKNRGAIDPARQGSDLGVFQVSELGNASAIPRRQRQVVHESVATGFRKLL